MRDLAVLLLAVFVIGSTVTRQFVASFEATQAHAETLEESDGDRNGD